MKVFCSIIVVGEHQQSGPCNKALWLLSFSLILMLFSIILIREFHLRQLKTFIHNDNIGVFLGLVILSSFLLYSKGESSHKKNINWTQMLEHFHQIQEEHSKAKRSRHQPLENLASGRTWDLWCLPAVRTFSCICRSILEREKWRLWGNARSHRQWFSYESLSGIFVKYSFQWFYLASISMILSEGIVNAIVLSYCQWSLLIYICHSRPRRGKWVRGIKLFLWNVRAK